MIDRIRELPHLPQLTMELLRDAFADDPDIQKLAATIERDPAFTAKLFRTVNSAAFGCKAEVSSVGHAVSFLGIDTLRTIIAAIALGEYLLKGDLGRTLDVKRLCLHSLASAVIMREVGRRLGSRKADHFYLLGLLHDLGILALDSMEGYDYGKVLARLDEGEPLLQAERKVFATDHLAVWELLAEAWGFPEEILLLREETLGSTRGVRVPMLTAYACRTADVLGYAFLPFKPNTGGPEPVAALVDEAAFREVQRAVQAEMEVMGSILNLPLPGPEEFQEILTSTAYHLSLANLHAEHHRRNLAFRVEVLEQLSRVVSTIHRNLNSETLTFTALEILLDGICPDGVFLLRATEGKGLHGYVAGRKDGEDADLAEVRIPSNAIPPLLAECIEDRAPRNLPVSALGATLAAHAGGALLFRVVSMHVQNKTIGLLGFGTRRPRDPRFFNKDFEKVLAIIAADVGLALENARLYRRARTEARMDALTGIYNRRAVMKILASEFARFRRKHTPLTVVLFDVDHFKLVNDRMGHLAGDQMLKTLGGIFREGFRESDYAGRYGGDEFLAVFPGTLPEEVRPAVDRVRERFEAFCAGFMDPAFPYTVSLSSGIAGAEASMQNERELIRRADQALYEAKEEGRNTVCTAKPTPPS